MDPFNKKLHFYITDVDEDSDQVLVIVKEDPASQDSSSVNNLIAEKLPYSAATIATPIRSKEALSEKYGLRPFYVTHVDSPTEIYVRPASLADGWQNFKDSIESKLSNNSVRYRKEALINDLVGIVNNVNCYRGEIVDIIDPNTFLVRDIDKGSRETVRSEDMFELPECLLDVNAFCHLVSLAHILPTGTSKPGVWSQEAKEWFKEEAEKYGEVFLSIEVI